ncbi:MAG: 50S ribosomal protein L21 [Pedosphaera sp.]|nr:50S ribosomal protein L21 [Pedosphaera sp.]MSU43319.1 50S ribosomal protein L21 [Pedosphaera sp.]
MYAIIETGYNAATKEGSKQYRVAVGDVLEVEELKNPTGELLADGAIVSFDRVLLFSQEGKVIIGTPTVSNATVEASVVKHKRGPKLVIFKMKRRKNYHRKKGHRQDLTVIKITNIKA